MYTDSLKSLGLLWTNLASNHRYKIFIDSLDIETFNRRLENEGLTFLTCTLPRLGKALDEFHSTTEWKPPLGFKLKEINGLSLPIFMGKVIDKALAGDSLAVDCVRQLSYIFYKLEVEYDKETVHQFLENFKQIDKDLDVPFRRPITSKMMGHLEGMRRIISRVLCNVDPRDIRPYHGSGATACRTVNYDKWHKLRYYPSLDAFFSYSEYFFYSPSHLIDELEKLEEAPYSRPCARVVLVPKDSRGPRIISCEPAELMFIQQGLMDLMYRTIESHPLTSGQINFSDQAVNRSLAHLSSLTGELATIDLSDASDRVSSDLVKAVFPSIWVEALFSCRSTHTLLPDGSEVELNKFAPMGSSCCFPVEALVFWASAYVSIHGLGAQSKLPVYVYGDDIIIYTSYASAVINDLEMLGLKVNTNKSYLSGPFRESCGGDYHKGMDVTPVRVRKFLRGIGTDIATGADLINLFLIKFGESDSRSLISVIENCLGQILPRTDLPIPGTIRLLPVACNDVFFRRRWNKNLQRFEHQIPTIVSRTFVRRPPSWCELLKKELSLGRQVNVYARDDMPFLYKEGNRVSWNNTKNLLPGEYVDPHSARKSWAWVWLG